ncbi:MAG: hypothetical protein QOE59_2543 [Actinomycetota bacterium]|jgi:hypothetical protein|nr:hypothetical protein [Actinomycetota bacterium]
MTAVPSEPAEPSPIAGDPIEPGERQRVFHALRSSADAMRSRNSLRDLDATLSDLVAKAVETVPSADAGGITFTQDTRIDSKYHTADPIGELDELQSRLNEGPCITAAEDPPVSGVILADDLAGEDADRWPRYAKAAVDAGYRSMCSTQLSGGSQSLRAALNLYSTTPKAFDTESQLVAALFGVQAGILLYGAENAAQLQRAIDSRDVIGQAKGILMERFGLDDSEAFQMLVKSSQDTNLKLVKVAAWVRDDLDERRRQRGGGSD